MPAPIKQLWWHHKHGTLANVFRCVWDYLSDSLHSKRVTGTRCSLCLRREMPFRNPSSVLSMFLGKQVRWVFNAVFHVFTPKFCWDTSFSTCRVEGHGNRSCSFSKTLGTKVHHVQSSRKASLSFWIRLFWGFSPTFAYLWRLWIQYKKAGGHLSACASSCYRVYILGAQEGSCLTFSRKRLSMHPFEREGGRFCYDTAPFAA